MEAMGLALGFDCRRSGSVRDGEPRAGERVAVEWRGDESLVLLLRPRVESLPADDCLTMGDDDDARLSVLARPRKRRTEWPSPSSMSEGKSSKKRSGEPCVAVT